MGVNNPHQLESFWNFRVPEISPGIVNHDRRFFSQFFFGSAVHERNENVFFSFSASLFGCRLTFPTEWNVFFL